jgi:diguanylate cyclase (GGDEF)-like protein
MITRRSVATGAAAGLALAAAFVAVVAGTAGRAHLGQQVRTDWWLLAPLMAGFATHGHLVGDDVLRGVADVLRAQVRDDKDLIGRFGGEEFAVFLPGVDATEAPRAAERLRWGVAELVTPVNGVLVHVTVSVGVTVTDPVNTPNASVSELLAGADLGLYQAKAEGRDLVRLLARPDRRTRRM